MEAAMTTTQMNIEKNRVFDLNLILFWIEEAKIKIGRLEWNLHFSNIAGEGVKYSDRIEILNQSINRLNNRYFKTLNK
tara:strand:+ start:659 stop:892 length:234 start_codon:yes stop_codon:yes gene_type:complete